MTDDLLSLNWDYPDPFIITLKSKEDEADGYGHINNSVYVSWMDQCAWQHCEAVKMTPEFCRNLNAGFAAIRHEIDYLTAAYPNQNIAIANWVTLNDGRLRAERRFQIIRIDDGQTLLRCISRYVCINLTTGRPKRVPKDFLTGFVVEESVQQALKQLSQDS